MKQFFLEHVTVISLMGYWLLSIFVTALPKDPKDFSVYKYFYDTSHGIVGALAGKFGGVPPTTKE